MQTAQKHNSPSKITSTNSNDVSASKKFPKNRKKISQGQTKISDEFKSKFQNQKMLLHFYQWLH